MRNIKNVKNVLFDLDGTIIDSSPGVIKCLHYAFESIGFTDYREEDLREFFGPPLYAQMKSFCRVDDDTAAFLCRKFRELYRQGAMYENRLYPGIAECMKKLRESGRNVFVATSKVQIYAIDILERHGITEFLTDICGSEPDRGINTKSDVISHLLEKNGINDISECVMVGDRHYDVEGARAFGMDTIGVTFGFGDRDELTEAGAKYTVDTAEELFELIFN